MATWNTDKPAVGNTIAADIPDIEENLQELHDVIEAITNGTLGTTTAANFKVDVLADGANCGDTPVISTGINDGTQDIDFPTNNMSACKFMTGNSNTILWMYLNTAPPGWKALSTGADKLIGIVGGTGAYNVNGGNIAGTSFDDLEAHTHEYTEVPNHVHVISFVTTTGGAVDKIDGSNSAGAAHDQNTANPTGGVASATTDVSSLTEARPTAALGKLFQFDTA